MAAAGSEYRRRVHSANEKQTIGPTFELTPDVYGWVTSVLFTRKLTRNWLPIERSGSGHVPESCGPRTVCTNRTRRGIWATRTATTFRPVAATVRRTTHRR